MLHMMGVETEFSIAALDKNGSRVQPGLVSEQLLRKAKDRFAYLSDAQNRLYLANGGLLYIDHGAHPEFATPECTTPDTIVQYIQAGDAILDLLSKELEDSTDITEVRTFKGNVDYTNPDITWGCHESYLHRANWYKRSPQLIPHLVSRIIFTGGGGWNNRSPGLEFSVSPRVNHLIHEISDETTQDRGIFHTKNESHCGKHHLNRLHIICGVSAFSETANWLKMGTTALVIAMVDQKLRVGGSGPP